MTLAQNWPKTAKLSWRGPFPATQMYILAVPREAKNPWHKYPMPNCEFGGLVIKERNGKKYRTNNVMSTLSFTPRHQELHVPFVRTSSFPLRMWYRSIFISNGLRFMKYSAASSPKNINPNSWLSKTRYVQGPVCWRSRKDSGPGKPYQKS